MEMNELLLRTAFACMSCDGSIAKEEVDLIKQMSEEKHLFGDVDIDEKLAILVREIKQNGKIFLKKFLIDLKETHLTEEQELKIADVAVQTIRADKMIDYNEIKFFKIIRSNLKIVSDEILLKNIDGIDENYLAQDICSDYFQIYEDYFGSIILSNIENPKVSTAF